MPDLPSGTVTFLFTDIEGSTRLWERDRAAMQTAVARCIAILQESLTAHGGVLFKTIGDGTQAAFPSAPAAPRSALEAQLALTADPWPNPPGPLLVRMALHAGEAIPDERGDYLAVPLNRLARLVSTAHGGQILLTDAVARLVQDALPHDASLRDLGERALRDLARPERAFALVHPALPDDAGHAHARGSVAPLPVALTPFVGRTAEVTAITALAPTAHRLGHVVPYRRG